ncbi:MAG: carboxypeptidase regulatory-like domain-containing protein [Bryobacteraceae bacterium]|nr:carboxypeptidase regulatory-like domain-containing protein [Bryobacteraceae bacterium]
MKRRRKLEILAVTSAAAAVLAAILSSIVSRPERVTSLTGAVLREDSDPRRQRPILGADVTIVYPAPLGGAKTDASGLFALDLGPGVVAGQTLKLAVHHPEYQPVYLDVPADERPHVIRMNPQPETADGAPPQSEVRLRNIRMRYAIKRPSTVTVGSAVRAFEVANTGSVPCDGEPPCSPDGKWKAATGSVSLDAGERNEFRNARVSCIAGPCPFSRIASDEFSQGGRVISASVLNWSDTVTYLIEAEVTHTRLADAIHFSYPAIFGESMNFTLPASAQGLSIEADLNGSPIVFPLGPRLRLSWADCSLKIASDQTKVYRCDVKPGYRF